MCPRCFSLERHRIIWHFLVDNLDFINKKRRMLHIAPEQCFYYKFRKLGNLDYTTADLESPLADILMDITEIPFEDERFDFIMCNHVLEHVKDDRKAMSELFRVLKKGGEAILQVPLDYQREFTYEDENVTSPEERKIKFWGRDHVRLYGRDYLKRLNKIGWKTEDKIMKFSEKKYGKQLLLKDYRIIYLRK